MEHGLTQRQLEMLKLVQAGLSTKEIARELGLSPFTVDTHISEAIRRMGASSRRDAARTIAATLADGGIGSDIPNSSVDRSMGIPGTDTTDQFNGVPESARHDREQKAGPGPKPSPNSEGVSGHNAKRATSHHLEMLQVVVTYVVDAFYVLVFFAVMSAAAYGAHILVKMAEANQFDPTVQFILRIAEIILVAIDATGVVLAGSVLTYRFLMALVRASR